jgi:hypothetical protein
LAREFELFGEILALELGFVVGGSMGRGDCEWEWADAFVGWIDLKGGGEPPQST